MSDFSLPKLLSSLHEDIQHRLRLVRESIQHPGSKGDASEGVWISLLQKYLPQRYQADKAFVVDSHGNFSQQIDVVVFDRQYSPFIFNYEDTLATVSRLNPKTRAASRRLLPSTNTKRRTAA